MTINVKDMSNELKKGFTLIELLIVIAILGVLAVVVLIAINPAEQLARTRDAGRQSTVTQLGHAVQAYYTGQNGTAYPPTTSWYTDLVNSGELTVFPSSINYGTGATALCPGTSTDCCAENDNGTDFCYDDDATGGGGDDDGDVIVYAMLESTQQNSKCSTSGDPVAWSVFSTNDARGGVVCVAQGSPPTADGMAAGTWTFLP